MYLTFAICIMKRITLKNIQPSVDEADKLYQDRKQYKVHPGNGKILYFASKRKSHAFLGQYSKFLNRVL